MIYLDHASASAPNEMVYDLFYRFAKKNFVNQEASHAEGKRMINEILHGPITTLELLLNNAEDNPKEVFTTFFYTATDLFAHIFLPYIGQTIFLTTQAEHPAIIENLPKTDTYFIPLLSNGEINLIELEKAFERFPNAILILHHVNSQTGVIQNLSEVCKFKKQGHKIFIDGVQAIGKVPLPYAQLPIDGVAISSRKFGGVPCAGWVHNTQTDQLFFENLRKTHKIGRIDIATLHTFSVSVIWAIDQCSSLTEKYQTFLDYMRQELNFENIVFVGDRATCSPAICSLLLKNIQSAIIVRMLSDKGIMVSAGSACLSESGKPSGTLAAMKIDKSLLWGLLRVSFSPQNTLDEIKTFCAELKIILKNY